MADRPGDRVAFIRFFSREAFPFKQLAYNKRSTFVSGFSGMAGIVVALHCRSMHYTNHDKSMQLYANPAHVFITVHRGGPLTRGTRRGWSRVVGLSGVDMVRGSSPAA